MKIKDFFSFSKNRIFWLNILGMIVFVVAVIFGTLKWIDIYTRHGKSVIVPNVVGMPAQAAAETLTRNRLEATVIDSSYVPNAQPGSVVDQRPVAGAKVKEDRLIYLVICTANMPTHTIPDVIDNSSAREAAARLQAVGFSLTENEYIAGEKDWVYGVRYKGHDLTSGDKVPIKAELTLVVGSGEITQPQDSIDVTLPENQPDTHSPADDPDNSWF